MGWEILHDKDLGKAVFMCNTMDSSDSPVFYVDSDFDKGLFYKCGKDESSRPTPNESRLFDRTVSPLGIVSIGACYQS